MAFKLIRVQPQGRGFDPRRWYFFVCNKIDYVIPTHGITQSMLTNVQAYLLINFFLSIILGTFLYAPRDPGEKLPACEITDDSPELSSEAVVPDVPVSEIQPEPQVEPEPLQSEPGPVQSVSVDPPAPVEAPAPVKPRNTPKYNHHLWSSPRPVVFARALIKRNPRLKPEGRLTHEVALALLARQAKVTLESLLDTNPLVYSKRYMFNVFPLGDYVRRSLQYHLTDEERAYFYAR